MMDVLRNKIPARDAITIGKQKVIRCGGNNRLIEDLPLPETFILMPDMPYGKVRFALEPFNDLTGIIARAVIRYDYLKVSMDLTLITPKNLFNPFGLIIGADDNRNFHPAKVLINSRTCGRMNPVLPGLIFYLQHYPDPRQDASGIESLNAPLRLLCPF